MADRSGAEAYQRSFARLCAGAVEPLLDLAGPPTGRLIDVGSGPGTVALTAAARGWSVVAVEPDPAMRRLAAAAGVDVEEGRLPALPLPDGVFSASAADFVVDHLPDPRAGMRELARIVEPGGTVAVSIQPAGASALPDLWDRVIAGAGTERPAGVALDPALDFPRTAAGLAGLLAGAGPGEVAVTSAEFDFTVRPDDLWSAVEAGIGVIGTTWRAASSRTRAAMGAVYADVVVERLEDEVLRFPATALLGRGVR